MKSLNTTKAKLIQFLQFKLILLSNDIVLKKYFLSHLLILVLTSIRVNQLKN